MLKNTENRYKVIKFEPLDSTCHIKFWLFLTKTDDFYLRPKRNSRMTQAWDQAKLSPCLLVWHISPAVKSLSLFLDGWIILSIKFIFLITYFFKSWKEVNLKYFSKLFRKSEKFHLMHRDAFCMFPFRWIYYYGSNN